MPLTADITGLRVFSGAASTSSAAIRKARAFSGSKSKSPMSAPAQNDLSPLPVMMTTRMAGVRIGLLQAFEDPAADADAQGIELVRLVEREDSELAPGFVVDAAQSHCAPHCSSLSADGLRISNRSWCIRPRPTGPGR